jgi:hypothetical protein
MEDLAVIFGEKGRWPSYHDELLDAVTAGPSASSFATGHGVQISRTKDLAMIFNVGGHWPSCHDKILDTIAVGHSMSVLADGVGEL